MIGRSYGRRGRRREERAGLAWRTKCRVGIQSGERRARGEEGDLARLYHCNILESNYRPTNLITASEGAGGRARMPVEMGDAATSIVGRLITLSGCLPQATGVIRPPFIPAGASLSLSLTLIASRPSSLPPRNPKTDGASDFKEATMRRIIRYFHVRWLDWNVRLESREARLGLAASGTDGLLRLSRSRTIRLI